MFYFIFTHSVTCVTLDKTRLASGSIDKTIRIWDIKTGEQTHIMKGHNRGVWCLNFFTQNLLISGSYDGTVRVSAEHILMWKGNNSDISSIVL